ncbi:MAG: hypothetical protein IPO27_02240 [Bacteroidetes bacterium]|nr:hypothetical protein [Bacteroidota bacterium]
MKLNKLILTLFLSLGVMLSNAQTVDEVIDKYFKAIGGKEKLDAIKSMRMKMSMMAGPMEIPIEISIKKPNMMYTTVTVQGMNMRTGYDGKTGWSINPFQGDTVPHKMSEEEIREVQDQADINGPLYDYKAKGNTVELAGKEEMEGSDVYKLKIIKKSGDVEYYFLDAGNYYLLKSLSKKNFQGKEVESETIFSDYKELPGTGIIMAYGMESRAVGESEGQKMTITSIEPNLDMEDAMFLMPGK